MAFCFEFPLIVELSIFWAKKSPERVGASYLASQRNVEFIVAGYYSPNML